MCLSCQYRWLSDCIFIALSICHRIGKLVVYLLLFSKWFLVFRFRCEVVWNDMPLTLCFSALFRCNGGVFRVRCGGVPGVPDLAHHRGKDAGIFCEGQNRGAALSAGPVGHAASSQARMQRQTAPGSTRAHTSVYAACRVFS